MIKLLAVTGAATLASAEVSLVGTPELQKFVELNDPVMGGKSTGTYSVSKEGFGVFDGEVNIVPSLKAPGFIKTAADLKFADASSEYSEDGSFVLKVRTTTPAYKGFRFSFASGTMSAQYSCAGGGGIPFSRGCFKSEQFDVPAGADWTEIRLPINSFSDKWSSATGEQTTKCSDDKDVCPSAKTLSKIQRVEFWGEGAEGKLHLEIASVSVVGSNALNAVRSDNNAVPLVTFDKAPATTHEFKELNDPVMGGKSTGTWSVNDNGYGVMDGEVVNVPKLKAPGFINAAAGGKFPDASAEHDGGSFVLTVRTTTPAFKGYRFSFASGTVSPLYSCAGGGSIPFSRGCFKSEQFDVPAGSEWTEIRLPINSFSDKWNSATGEQTTKCSDDKDVCPSAKNLASIQELRIWGEGAAGKIHLEIKSISVEGATTLSLSSSSKRPPAGQDTCKNAVQSNLRFNISTRTTAETLEQYVDEGEDLATAVCCDLRTAALAEPQFTFMAPDVALFTKMSQDGITTFYDSICGLPLFKTPVNRTLAEFQADTTEHGWPSFRVGEVFTENLSWEKKLGGYVTSKCGTHLGTYLPDDKGDRWCIDLACISGNSA